MSSARCMCMAPSLQIKERCRKGIPSSLRHQAWLRLSGAHRAKEQQPLRFEVCVRACVCVCEQAKSQLYGEKALLKHYSHHQLIPIAEPYLGFISESAAFS